MFMKGPSGSKKLFAIFFVITILVIVALGKIFLDSIYVPVIAMYHSVGHEGRTLDGYGEKLNVTPEAFQKQMEFLKDKRYNVMPLARLVEMMKEKKKIPHKTIAITFDDGLKNNYTYAYPVLKKCGFPATIFVITDYVGKENFLDWNEIKTMQENNISIGSHTMSHGWLPSMGDKKLRKEIFESKEILEQKTGRPVEVLSYPIGAFNKKAKKAARNAGYIGAVATNPGSKYPSDDIYALKRIRISMTSDNMFVFWVETSGYYTFIKEVRDED